MDQLWYHSHCLCIQYDINKCNCHIPVHFCTLLVLDMYRLCNCFLPLDNSHPNSPEDIYIYILQRQRLIFNFQSHLTSFRSKTSNMNTNLAANQYMYHHYNKAVSYIHRYRFHIGVPKNQLDRNWNSKDVRWSTHSKSIGKYYYYLPLESMAHWHTKATMLTWILFTNSRFTLFASNWSLFVGFHIRWAFTTC